MRCLALFTLLFAIVACGGDPAAMAKAMPQPDYQMLIGRYWMAQATDQFGKTRITQRIEFLPDLARRIVYDPSFAVIVNGKAEYREVEMSCSVISTVNGSIVLNLMGGKDIWKIVPLGPDEIRIGSTVFRRGDASQSPKVSLQR